jgi:hypothetical protein
MNKYICYFEKYNDRGELVDDFKEWGTANTRDEAREMFQERYPKLRIAAIREI